MDRAIMKRDNPVFNTLVNYKSRKPFKYKDFRLKLIDIDVVCEYYFKNFFIILFNSFGL